MDSKSRYKAFLTLAREMHDLARAEELLSWDQQTFMPPKGAEARAAELSTIAGIGHGLLTGEEMAELLSGLDESEKGGLDRDARVNVREIRRLYERERKIPKRLVQELARTRALSQQAWVEARRKSDFPSFAPWLKKIVDLRIEIAEAVGYEECRYDALLDEFEPGATSGDLEGAFAVMREDLVPFVRQVLEAGRKRDTPRRRGPFPRTAQDELIRFFLEKIGFDMEAGRLDVSAHPFTSGNVNDVRLTTRYDEEDLGVAFFGALHEAGHGLYEQGLDPDHEGTPRAESVSLGIHESQSRMWENMVGRSLPFWEYAFPIVSSRFPAAFRDSNPIGWYGEVNRVEASFIRVEADEVTYNLHILLRFELEKELVDRNVAVEDLPDAWNNGMKRYLGITPPDDAHGVLQDIHWPAGYIGYFPTYALGNLYAAQFRSALNRAIPDLDEQIRVGEFGALLSWLRKEIHRHGKTYPATELVEKVTGKPLDASYLNCYLREKYIPLYDL